MAYPERESVWGGGRETETDRQGGRGEERKAWLYISIIYITSTYLYRSPKAFLPSAPTPGQMVNTLASPTSLCCQKLIFVDHWSTIPLLWHVFTPICISILCNCKWSSNLFSYNLPMSVPFWCVSTNSQLNHMYHRERERECVYVCTCMRACVLACVTVNYLSIHMYV